MKVLLIAEEEKTTSALIPVIKKTGAETIVYRWLLKALDNVEEIAPDMVVISTAEYPRHWKTFAQFTKSAIGGVVPKIILYNSRPMSDDEKAKARSLGVFVMLVAFLGVNLHLLTVVFEVLAIMFDTLSILMLEVFLLAAIAFFLHFLFFAALVFLLLHRLLHGGSGSRGCLFLIRLHNLFGLFFHFIVLGIRILDAQGANGKESQGA